MELKVKERIVAELEKIVGAEHVSTALSDLYSYSQDMTENEPSWPDFVVMPGSVEEIQEILRLANREKVPVIPIVGGANIGGLTIPLEGGISLDLRRMDRVIELNEEDMYVILEPGVTFGHLARYLDKNCPQLTYSYPAAPPHTSVMCNALLMGMGGMMLTVGANFDNINGMEVVLPTGEVVKIGSCSVSPYWFSRAPLPDVGGLFVGWQGTTGVVTKIAVQLWPKPRHAELMALFTYDIGTTFRFMRRIARTGVVDGVSAIPFSGLMVHQARIRGPVEKNPGEPEFSVAITTSAYNEDLMRAKAAARDEIIAEEFKDAQVTPVPVPDLGLAGDNIRHLIRGSIEYMGGVTWMGTFCPTSKWEEATVKVNKLFDKYKLINYGAYAPLRGGHFGMWRPIVGFNKDDPDELDRTRKFMRECGAMALDMGFVPYKASYWAVQAMMERGDPNWVELLRRVKKMLDPNNIMNPGRYGAPGE